MLELENNIESDEDWSDIPDTDNNKNESEDEFEQNDDNEKDKVIIERLLWDDMLLSSAYWFVFSVSFFVVLKLPLFYLSVKSS